MADTTTPPPETPPVKPPEESIPRSLPTEPPNDAWTEKQWLKVAKEREKVIKAQQENADLRKRLAEIEEGKKAKQKAKEEEAKTVADNEALQELKAQMERTNALLQEERQGRIRAERTNHLSSLGVSDKQVQDYLLSDYNRTQTGDEAKSFEDWIEDNKNHPLYKHVMPKPKEETGEGEANDGGQGGSAGEGEPPPKGRQAKNPGTFGERGGTPPLVNGERFSQRTLNKMSPQQKRRHLSEIINESVNQGEMLPIRDENNRRLLNLK